MIAPQRQIKNIRPQPGFQEKFLSSKADIVIGGGAAGAGKSFALLLEPLRFKDYSDFAAAGFRRTYPEITNPGGLWDTSSKIYPLIGAKPIDMDWVFPKKAKVVFRHLQHENDVYAWQGSQIPLILFDELTHFTAKQFWYLLSRNRNPSQNGIKSYVRATCNPDPDSFVADLVKWFIDDKETLEDGTPNENYGFPIPERSGLLRYFTKDGENLIWGSTEQEVIDKAPHLFEGELKDTKPKSLTFIPGDIYHNQELLKSDPGYLANLMAQDETEKSRLLKGNWRLRSDGLGLFEERGIANIFTNYHDNTDKERYITVDPARFGSDFCVIMVWSGWECIMTVIITKSTSHEIKDEIEKLRKEFRVGQTNVVVDQDGVGGGVVKLGSYQGFSGGALPFKDPDIRKKENYKNLKTQCYYKVAADHININNIRINISSETCMVDGIRSTKMKVKGEVVDVRDLIKQDLRAIKRAVKDFEGKLQINTKEEQKNILGRSPDFGDNIMMRKYCDLMPKRRFITVS